MIGRILNKRYKITELLGKGAMGTVYRATDTFTRQEVALKIIASELAIDPTMLERFKREARASARIMSERVESNENEVLAQELDSIGSKLLEVEKRLAEVERVIQGLESAAMNTARALEEVSSHWDSVYRAMRRAE